MDGKRPKRRKADDNPYSLSEKSGKYFVSFKTSNATTKKVEIGKDVYDFLDKCELQDLSQINKRKRHLDSTDLFEEILERTILGQTNLVEDSVLQRIYNEKLHMAISRLPETQRRRLFLYYFRGFTYEEIAKMEGCSVHSVYAALQSAKDTIKIFLKDF